MTRFLRCAVLILLAVTGCKKDTPLAEVSPASVRLMPSQGKLSTLLTQEVEKARARNLRPFLELRAEWCGPCKQLEASMGDDRMIDAFAGTYLISVDIDEWGDKLEPLGFETGSIPAFYELDGQAKPTGRTITGGAWAENIPANMAPPLKAFFAGK
jgi:thiol:disulfide interchange protein